MSYHQFENENGDKVGSFEVFYARIVEIECRCGTYYVPAAREGDEIFDTTCPSCMNEASAMRNQLAAWWWWACFPGCLPDGEPNGPFYSEKEALENAREE